MRRAFVLAVTALFASSAQADVRPISDVERTAAQIAIDYLTRGPEAVVQQLAASSPLRKLSPSDALAEIEVRLGPPSGATWELQTVVPALKDKSAVFGISYPSGVDDAVVFDFVPEAGTFKVQNIRMLAQESKKIDFFENAAIPRDTHEHPSGSRLPLIAGIVAALASLIAAFATSKSRLVARALIATAAGMMLGSFAVVIREKGQPPPAMPVSVAPRETDPLMAPLLQLRRAVASGSGDIDAAFASAPKRGACGDVATLWRAQFDMQQMKLDDVKRTLGRYASASYVPLVEILRARRALLQGDEASSAVAYERAVNLGPGRDGLWLETAHALLALGYDERAARYLRRLTRIGSRDSGVYYTLAMYEASNHHEDDSERLLGQAWRMRPAERAELVEAGILWSILRREKTANVISLSAPAEATFASPVLATHSIVLPPGAQSRVSGEFLDVRVDQQELLIPGGAALAPAGTRVVDAGEWARTDEQQSLRDLPQLVRLPHNAALFAQPSLRLRMIHAAAALANHNRWTDLLQLTDGLSPTTDQVPPELLFLRATALQRTQRAPEAKQLVTDLTASRVLQRKRDARALIQLGESLAAFDLFDPAIKMLDKAQAIHANPVIDERLRQIEMHKQLATRYQTYNSGHFEIHYPNDMPVLSAQQIGVILESEYKRLQSWVPTPNFQPVVVNIVWWHDFRSIYTGNDFILGFYQGKITLPFAGVMVYVPEVVAILSHELCHALIAQATNDQAPRWFHEGLAQRVEMRRYHANAFNMYDDNRLLAVSLIDSVMRGSPDPDMIGEAYIESQTVIRYIESAYGHAGVAKLLAAFRNGATTEDAIRALTGDSVAAFDQHLRGWGRSGQRVFENPEPIHYDNMGN